MHQQIRTVQTYNLRPPARAHLHACTCTGVRELAREGLCALRPPPVLRKSTSRPFCAKVSIGCPPCDDTPQQHTARACKCRDPAGAVHVRNQGVCMCTQFVCVCCACLRAGMSFVEMDRWKKAALHGENTISGTPHLEVSRSAKPKIQKRSSKMMFHVVCLGVLNRDY